MPEIPQQRNPERTKPKSRQVRKLTGELATAGVGHIDETSRLINASIPTLAAALGANTHNIYGLRGRYGSIYRETKLELPNGDKAEYNVLFQRLEEPYGRRKKFARLVLEVVTCETHMLDDHELMAEWPLIESVGAAEDVLAGAFKMFAADDHKQDYDAADPEAVALLMRSHADMIVGPDDEYTAEELAEMGLYEDDEDTDEEEDDDDDDSPHEETIDNFGKAMYGQPIYRYFEKTLRVERGAQPTLKLKAGYETDAGNFPLKLGDDAYPSLVGTTMPEFDLFSQLNRESFMTVDSELVREFENALAILGITQHLKGRA